ncbi:MAG: 4-hydroxy-tetrahydrodipicolinate synthase [Lachnoclostridium sp.]|nr:4-hydroxy-tetrahydrodipicolinate synthase [Lachnoclostridium sp.]
MSHHIFRGQGIALATPFADDGSIDTAVLGRHVDSLCNAGVDFIVALGTTAETPTLSAEEKQLVVDTVRGHAGSVPVVVGIGGNCTANVVNEIRHTDFNGISAILSVAPYYNKPSQRGLYGHFAAIAEACPVDVILYNVPSRTGVNVEAATTLALAEAYPDKVVAIKEASGRLEQAETILNRRHDGFSVLSGDDSLAHSMIKMGADGVISVLGNVFPEKFGRMIYATLDGEIEDAALIHQSFSALYSLLFRDGNPSGVKAALSCVIPGYKENLRLPLVPVSDETRAEIADFIKSFENG